MHVAEKRVLDTAIKKIIKNPAVGELKVGDLAGVQVFKYKHNAQLYLLAYMYFEDELVLNKAYSKTFIET